MEELYTFIKSPQKIINTLILDQLKTQMKEYQNIDKIVIIKIQEYITIKFIKQSEIMVDGVNL